MSYIASGGATKTELARALHFPNDQKQLLQDLADLRRQLQEAATSKSVDLNLAHSLWLDGTYASFREEYVKAVREAFAASLHHANFTLGVQVSQDINNWISDKTRGKIQKSVRPEDFASRSSVGVIDEPALVSVNAIYFKAVWGSRFDKAATRKRPFRIRAETTVDAIMMHQRSPLLYSENDSVQFLEIPYLKGGYSMYVILPKEVIPIRKLTDMVTLDMVVALRRHAVTHNVDLLLPKFEMKNHLPVKEALSAMGVKTAFDKDKADFDQMIVKKQEAFRIYLSQIYHEAWIEVNEEGTEASAATTKVHYSIGCSSAGRPRPAQFHADHPFLFLILHNQSRSILFAGWVSSPEELVKQAGAADG